MRTAVRNLLSEEISSSSSLSFVPRELKAHLACCAFCAAEARALDPTLLFVPLSASVASAPPVEEVRRVSDDILAEVRRRSRLAPPTAARPFFSRRFLRVAALVALAAGLFGIEGVRLARRGRAVPPVPVAVAPMPDERQHDVREAARPLIQDLKNPGARVYEFAAVSPNEPSVVFIADPHADL
ncbi:MAG TPA: hypothetical protein VF425_04020 [Thermoanaerobaculia bacterium]